MLKAVGEVGVRLSLFVTCFRKWGGDPVSRCATPDCLSGSGAT